MAASERSVRRSLARSIGRSRKKAAATAAAAAAANQITGYGQWTKQEATVVCVVAFGQI